MTGDWILGIDLSRFRNRGRPATLAILVVCWIAPQMGCGPSEQAGAPATGTISQSDAPTPSPASEADDPPTTGQLPLADRVKLAPGLVVDSVRASIEPSVDVGDRIITLVRIDPGSYRFRLLTATVHGARTARDWSREFGLTGVINASMFRPDRHSTGFMVDGEHVNNGSVNPYFGAFLAFDPLGPELAPVTLAGRDCPGFEFRQMRENYRVVIQNYRMLDCDGRPIAWHDPKLYSVAAVGLDRSGRIVFMHSRTPYRMRDFNTMIATPELEIAAAMFVEGGPEASLYVRTENETVERTGSWETGFFDDSNTRFWPIPNVIGFSPREG